MYVHYEINTAYGNTKILVQSVMSDLANVFNGNFTNTSSFNPASCIISASEFYGSTNTTIYPVANVVWTTNATATVPDVLTFNKRPGNTSYGFVIPSNINPTVLANIDTITSQVKQKLLINQQNTGITTS